MNIRMHRKAEPKKQASGSEALSSALRRERAWKRVAMGAGGVALGAIALAGITILPNAGHGRMRQASPAPAKTATTVPRIMQRENDVNRRDPAQRQDSTASQTISISQINQKISEIQQSLNDANQNLTNLNNNVPAIKQELNTAQQSASELSKKLPEEADKVSATADKVNTRNTEIAIALSGVMVGVGGAIVFQLRRNGKNTARIIQLTPRPASDNGNVETSTGASA